MSKPLARTVDLDGAIIRHESGRRGWNQAELARKTGISRPTVSIAWRGGSVTARTADRINRAFIDNPPTLDGLLRRRAS